MARRGNLPVQSDDLFPQIDDFYREIATSPFQGSSQ